MTVDIKQDKDGYYTVVYPKTTNVKGTKSVLGTHICPICNLNFEVSDTRYRYHKGTRYFCSYSCMQSYKRSKHYGQI